VQRTIAVITAGGSGLRMNSDKRKQYIEIGNKPILAHTINKFCITPEIDEIIITAPAEDVLFVKESIVKKYNFSKVTQILAGGNTRQESVYNALKSFKANEDDIILIHDGVRPFVSHEMITECINCLRNSEGAAVGIKPVDTIKKLLHDNIDLTLNREELFAVQTPQAFRFGFISKCHELARNSGFIATDDCSLAENFGLAVLGRKPVLTAARGSMFNIKITTPDDLILAEALLDHLGL
jgi:2-C-methyl-D-erythritol 4-phosphate cytidylyltransferase